MQVKGNQRIIAGLMGSWVGVCLVFLCVATIAKKEKKSKKQAWLKCKGGCSWELEPFSAEPEGSGQPIWGPLGQIPNTNTVKERQKAQGGRLQKKKKKQHKKDCVNVSMGRWTAKEIMKGELINWLLDLWEISEGLALRLGKSWPLMLILSTPGAPAQQWNVCKLLKAAPWTLH